MTEEVLAALSTKGVSELARSEALILKIYNSFSLQTSTPQSSG